MLKTIEDIKMLGSEALNWTGGGEPVLHPHFSEFVALAADEGLKQGLFTNGYQKIPHQNVFSWIRISLTDKPYENIIIPDVPFGICLNQLPKHTKKDLIKICLEAREIGARYFQVRPALQTSYKKQTLMLAPDYLKEYRTDKFDVYVTDYKYEEANKPKTYRDCYGYHFCPSIDWRGRLLACLYMTNQNKFVFGDLNKKPLLRIWGGISKKVPVVEACQNCCKNHEINKVLYAAKNIGLADFL